MRISAVTALASGAIALALTGCTDGSTTASPSADPSTATAPATQGSGSGEVNPCVVGTWHTVDAKGGNNIAGGGGVVVNVGATGDVTMDFSNMQPATFAASIAQNNVKGKFFYTGKASGKISTTSTSTTSGSWTPSGPIDWSQLKVTVELTEPVQGKPLDNAPISDYTGAKSATTGNVVDIAPMLTKGTYTCEGATLVLTPESNTSMAWTLGRKD